ncbi:MAG: transcription elongation factor GreA [Patescibacteria group bacterium]|nr:transcription elongation factor GreA [Patescibacteria group bacterium]
MSNPYYLSKEALAKLKEELDYLKKVKRKEVAEKIQAAIALGDLSENAEYHDAKDELGMLEGKISVIEDQIKNAVIIEEKHAAGDAVAIGSEVILETDGTKLRYRIVGPNEADPAHGLISNETPLAHAMLGHRAGESIEFEAPSGKKIYRILEIG